MEPRNPKPPYNRRSDAHRFPAWTVPLLFFSRERSEPPHIHVEAAGKYAKYWIRPVAYARSTGFRAHELAEIHRIIEPNQNLIVEKWNEHFGIAQDDAAGN